MPRSASPKDPSVLLEELRSFIASVRKKILTEQEIVSERVRTLGMIRIPKPVDLEITRITMKRARELEQVYGSPFFTKCVLLYPGETATQTVFFGKYQFSSEDIYSWVAPIASIRFEQPGDIAYTRPNGEVVRAKLIDKEQYMIVDGAVIYFAKESAGVPRTLIHHEYFSARKNAFELPEIVAIMEKAQDTVIRADHKGPFVISGPAGSGKTTLAFHRIAYLLQSPDTTELYPERSVAIFVQDSGAKDYFSHLLPSLGINNVKIVTFFEWAVEILPLADIGSVSAFGHDDGERDLYEYEKIKILRKLSSEKYHPNIFALLEKIYDKHFSAEFKELFAEQKKAMVLDRIDITILLHLYLKKFGKFESVRTYNIINKNGEWKKKTERKLITYPLMLVDEFQNYLPEQLTLLNHCLHEDTGSMIYVGDINQQIRLGTIRSFEEIGEKITDERNVVLHKVYRNTKQILRYIEGLGYKVDIPAQIKEGPAVTEKVMTTKSEIFQYVQDLILRNPEKSIGILSKDAAVVESMNKSLGGDDHVHVRTIIGSQGIEFDVVCIIGSWKEMFSFTAAETISPEFVAEKKRMQRDLLYVALTRAAEELYIIGDSYLNESIGDAA